MADPDFQRQMNEMFLLDTLSGHRDRHEGNFKIDRDANGRINVRAIDNDISFGVFGQGKDGSDLDRVKFGKSNGAWPYGGLPGKMQIDARMAERIRQISRADLDRTFSDLLTKEEIDALEKRFEEMNKYIKAMEDKREGLIVNQWNEKTAEKELLLAGGPGSNSYGDTKAPGGFAGNNYFQRQAVQLNMDTDAELRKYHYTL